MSRIVFAFSLLLLVGACAGREPDPVEVTRSSDANLSCEQMDAEIDANNGRIQSLLEEEDDKRTQNVLTFAGAVLLLPPLLFAMDFQDAAGTERQALQQRQIYLARLLRNRCGRNRRVVIASDPAPSDANQTPQPVAAEAEEIAAATRAALAYPAVPGSPPLYEGTAYASFTQEQISTYCQQTWTTRTNPTTQRTEYNPCTRRNAFR